MLEIKDVHNNYTGEEDLLFPLITTDTKDRLYKSNNWKKMHHIPLKATSINGY